MDYTERLKEERRREELMIRIRGLRLIDDDFMTACFSDNTECAQLVLRIILDKPDLVVKSVQTQRFYKNLQGRSVCLDIVAEDSENRQYDIEIQRADKGAGFRRARRNSALMDAQVQDAGLYGEKLPESYVIFITENDIIGEGKPLYEIERTIRDSEKRFDDGSHIIYVNGDHRDSGTALGRLMHDFFCTDPASMHYEELAERAWYFKNDEEGVTKVGRFADEMREEGRVEAIQEIAQVMKKEGISDEMIAKITGIVSKSHTESAKE